VRQQVQIDPSRGKILEKEINLFLSLQPASTAGKNFKMNSGLLPTPDSGNIGIGKNPPFRKDLISKGGGMCAEKRNK
jgi:hypothetical protein